MSESFAQQEVVGDKRESQLNRIFKKLKKHDSVSQNINVNTSDFEIVK